MPSICVIHLVWKPLGIETLRRFLSAYSKHPGGIEHKLVVAFNGFTGDDLREYRAALEGFKYDSFLVSPPTQDIPAYFEAAKRLDCEYLCFLNSYSEPLDPDWLAKMYEHARHRDVGMVGATGSWQSHRSLKQYAWGARSPYARIFRDIGEYVPHSLPRARFALSEEREREIQQSPLPRRLALRLYYSALVRPYHLALDYRRLRRERRKEIERFPASDFAPFPSPHLRSNAFMIRRGVMLGLTVWEMKTKDEAYHFESGRGSMTNQLLRKGLKVLVVGRNGYSYEPKEWATSQTFFQGWQGNLLVADNATRQYAEADGIDRAVMSRGAWGKESWTWGRNVWTFPGRARRTTQATPLVHEVVPRNNQ